MSFDTLAASPYGAIKLKLFEVTIGASVWRFTDAETVQNFNAQLWQPLAGIAHNDLPADSTNLDDSNKVVVNIPMNHELVQAFIYGAPAGVLKVNIWHGHVGDEFVQMWRGKLVEYGIKPPYAELVTENVLSSARRLAASLTVQTTCAVALGSAKCGVNLESFKTDAVVSALSGLSITATAIATRPNGWLVGGYAKWQHPDIADVQMMVNILEHTGNTVLVDMPVPSLEVGTAITLYPNCNKEIGGDCLNKFNNTINFRGLPHLDGRNPFSGTRLF